MIEVIKMLVKGLARHPLIGRRVLAIKKQVYTPLGRLEADAYPTEEPITREEAARMTPRRMRAGDEWATQHFGCCWFHLTGTVPAEAEGRRLVALVKVQGEGLSYEEELTGDLITSILSVPDVLQPPTIGKCVLHVSECAHKGDAVDIWMDTGFNGINGNFMFKAKYRYATLAIRNDDVWDYYYDYLTLALLLSTASANPRLTPKLREELCLVLGQSYDLFAQHRVDLAHQALRRYFELASDEQGVRYTLVGHAHLDLAWMWPERESRRKAVRTLTNALRQISRCPDYVFGVSQAQMLDWVRLSHPALFAELQQAVAAGNVELQGGMWVECDCNLPSGESLIRQFVYGDEFFLRYFGRTSRTVWLPDAFGFQHVLPQIIKGVGKDYFNTTKLTWNRVNKFPYQSFYWVGPDGSRVLSHISPEGTYCNDGSPLAVAKAERHNTQTDTGEALIIYGVGDGGGGPGEGHVQLAARQRGLAGMARTELGSAQSFFDRLATKEGLPEVNGELYLEYHRGTYTSQAAIKRLNRYAERNLHTLEWLLTVMGRDAQCTHPLWRTVLFNQFHDILPGSGIGRVHRESAQSMQNVVDETQRMAMDLLPHGEGFGWLNPSPFGRTEYHTHHRQTYLVRADGYATATYTPLSEGSTVGPDWLENRWVKVTFDKGRIVSYLDKTTGIEHAAKGLNTLRLYYDKDKRYDAWNIGPDYLHHPRTIRYLSSETMVDDGYAVMQVEYALPNGRIQQRIRLGYGKMVVFDTDVDWHEEHLMLRADFCPTVYADEALCDAPFGAVMRSTRNDTSIERAQFEVCAHKFVSVEDERGIFALYSDSKYGWRLKEGVLSLDLLRSPKYPDPQCDMGQHHFVYAMDLPASPMDAVAGGYNFNQPMLALDSDSVIRPLAWVDHPHVVLETIKPAASGEGYVLRLYERMGQAADCTLHTARGSAYFATDLEEHDPVPIEAQLHFAPHEIKTIWVRS